MRSKTALKECARAHTHTGFQGARAGAAVGGRRGPCRPRPPKPHAAAAAAAADAPLEPFPGRVPPAQGKEYYFALKDRGHDAEMLWCPPYPALKDHNLGLRGGAGRAVRRLRALREGRAWRGFRYEKHTHGLAETPKGEGDGLVNIVAFLRRALK